MNDSLKKFEKTWLEHLKKKAKKELDDENKLRDLILDPPIKPTFNQVPPVALEKRDKIWNISYPKIGEDLLDVPQFKANVFAATHNFIINKFPCNLSFKDSLEGFVEATVLAADEYSIYPSVTFHVCGGSFQDFLEFEKLESWQANMMFWKGSFVKSKTTGKIIGMNLTGLTYNHPTKFLLGNQPVEFEEIKLI